MFNDLKDFLVFACMPLMAAMVLILALVCVVQFADRFSCANLSEVTGRKTEWRFFGGCYVENGADGMIPYERWKMLDVRIKQSNKSGEK